MTESGSEGVLRGVMVVEFVGFWRQNPTNFHKPPHEKRKVVRQTSLPDHTFLNVLSTVVLDKKCGAPLLSMIDKLLGLRVA